MPVWSSVRDDQQLAVRTVKATALASRDEALIQPAGIRINPN